MRAFGFRLARLLELRQATERNQAAELGRAAGAEAEKSKQVETSSAQLEAVRGQAAANETPTAAGLLGAYRLAVQAASVQAESDAKALDQARVTRDKENDRYTVARQDRQVIERYREKRLETWQTETARSEQQVQDEVAQRRSAGKEGS
jgi:flagellar FliJ protein